MWVLAAGVHAILSLLLVVLALALLWRVGSWQVSSAVSLIEDEGLPIGALAADVTGYAVDHDVHLSFGGTTTFLVFGSERCEPCHGLLIAAQEHVVTRWMRLVFFSDSQDTGRLRGQYPAWEIYAFHDEEEARRRFRAPVSPYFHVIDATGRVAAKGVASLPAHLDRLLSLPTLSVAGAAQGREEHDDDRLTSR